jgi:sec-independent protein translocase protein TatB
MMLDPAKLLLIGLVALVVLGPEKLPAAAQKISSLLKDFQRMRASLQDEVHNSLGDLPFGDELRSAREAIGQVTQAADPRQALYRAVGLSSESATAGTGTGAGDHLVPGSIDLAVLEPSLADPDRSGHAADPVDVSPDPAPVEFDPSLN